MKRGIHITAFLATLGILAFANHDANKEVASQSEREVVLALG